MNPLFSGARSVFACVTFCLCTAIHSSWGQTELKMDVRMYDVRPVGKILQAILLPAFKNFLAENDSIQSSVKAYVKAVKEKQFPAEEHTFF